jgi:hypothetical protein
MVAFGLTALFPLLLIPFQGYRYLEQYIFSLKAKRTELQVAETRGLGKYKQRLVLTKLNYPLIMDY